MKVVRQIIPLLAIPLCLIASLFATAPWMRSFPASLAAAPLYGAAVLSVLVPFVTSRLRPGRLWLSITVDIVVFVVYALGVVLEDPLNVGDLWRGLYHGPSQVLTFALPLISPRSLMIAPALIVWAAGALAGECLARRWYTLLPYVGFLLAFGLAYAGTQRAAGSELPLARQHETVLATLLLLTLLVMRVAQAWVRQDETAESTQPDGVLPLRGLVVGTATTLVVAVVAALVVQTSAFPKTSAAPQRVPSIDSSRPLTPMSFIARMRPRTGGDAAQPVFTVTVDKAVPGYFPIANVDYYDGSGWSFNRTFRPSGGVLPADTDQLLAHGTTVTQQYHIASGPLTAGPWMPALYRPQKVTGAPINIDPASGMVVPVGTLTGGQNYTVRSTVSTATLTGLHSATAIPDTVAANDLLVQPTLESTVRKLANTFQIETKSQDALPLQFLQALQKDFRTNYTLSGAARGVATSTLTPSPSASSSSPSAPHSPRAAVVRALAKPTVHSSGAKHPKHGSGNTGKHPTKPPAKHPSGHQPTSSHTSAAPSTPAPSTPASASGPASDVAGGAGFSDVLASILGSRQGTPEQFATLVALVARSVGVPARVVTGFRVRSNGSTALQPGQYDVTTADAWTWAEIPIAGVGWVVVDATPGAYASSSPEKASVAPPPSTSSAPQSQNALVTQGNGGHAVTPKVHPPAASHASKYGVLVALLVALTILVIVLLLILVTRKPVRAARRRRAPDPRLRIVGAWRESMDVLTEAGLPELSSLTSAEIAELTAERFGADSAQSATTLGSAANAVTYSSATVVQPADADAAWQEHRLLRRQVLRTMTVRDRLATGLRYHRPRRRPTPSSPASWASATAARAEADKRSAGRHRSAGGRRRSH
ncbi:MAG TPA: transglutaminase domain-containing protein [Jatrophihabitantaceae bacterium]